MASGAGRDLDARIRAYWDKRVHDTPLSRDRPGSAGFFAALDAYRLRKADYLLQAVAFERWADRDVLEIGCGAGLDLVRFARAGAHAVGLDLSSTALDLAKSCTAVARQPLALVRGDGARLPFAAASFDLVYCHGVLSFASEPAAIVAESFRVLRPGGEAIFMVYNRNSWMWLASRLGLRLGHADAPGFRVSTWAQFDRLLAVFPQRRIVGERLPRPFRGTRGAWLRRFGWHLMAYCRRVE